MEVTTVNIEHIQIVHTYLFGGVKFLDFLLILMVVDIVTGVLKAAKEGKLRSRNALYGYARKIGVFGIIILANIIDQILALNGAVAVATVLFYVMNEGLSIVENLTQMGVKIPKVVTDKLHVVSNEEEKKEEK